MSLARGWSTVKDSQSIRWEDLDDGGASYEQTHVGGELLRREPGVVGGCEEAESRLPISAGEEFLVAEKGEWVDKVGEDAFSQSVLGKRLRTLTVSYWLRYVELR